MVKRVSGFNDSHKTLNRQFLETVLTSRFSQVMAFCFIYIYITIFLAFSCFFSYQKRFFGMKLSSAANLVLK